MHLSNAYPLNRIIQLAKSIYQRINYVESDHRSTLLNLVLLLSAFYYNKLSQVLHEFTRIQEIFTRTTSAMANLIQGPLRQCKVVLLLAVMLLAGDLIPNSRVSASDPDPLQDFCIADLSQGVQPSMNGYPCIDASLATTEDFAYAGLATPANLTGNPLGGTVTSGGVLHWPAMNTLGLEILRLDFAPGGIIMPHTHSLATEILYCLEGEIYTGFVTNSDNPVVPNKLYAKIVKKGEAFIFPRGLLHFQLNKGTGHAASLNTLNSQKPGLQLMPVALFGTGIDPELLEKSFFINATEVASLGSVLTQFADISI